MTSITHIATKRMPLTFPLSTFHSFPIFHASLPPLFPPLPFSPARPVPDDVRHDVYLTLSHGLFNKGTKRADKNVQVDVEVLNEKDQVLEVRDRMYWPGARHGGAFGGGGGGGRAGGAHPLPTHMYI